MVTSFQQDNNMHSPPVPLWHPPGIVQTLLYYLPRDTALVVKGTVPLPLESIASNIHGWTKCQCLARLEPSLRLTAGTASSFLVHFSGSTLSLNTMPRVGPSAAGGGGGGTRHGCDIRPGGTNYAAADGPGGPFLRGDHPRARLAQSLPVVVGKDCEQVKRGIQLPTYS